jgi:hypothetical protein
VLAILPGVFSEFMEFFNIQFSSTTTDILDVPASGQRFSRKTRAGAMRFLVERYPVIDAITTLCDDL